MSDLVRSAGGIVLGDSGTIALVRNRPDTKWFFPKGAIEAGDDDEAAARREIEEETGLTDLELIDDLGTYVRPGITPDGSYARDVQKEIHMFLFAAPPHSAVRAAHEVHEAVWMSFSKAATELEDAKDIAWFATVFDRVREAVQRD